MKIRIGHLSTIYHTALILQGLKMLGKRDIKATWKLFGGGPAIVEAVKKNEVDIGYIGLPPAMIGMAEGVGIKCVAGGHVEGTVLCTLDNGSGDGEEEAVGSLGGTQIGSPPKGSIHDIIMRHLLKKYGVEADVLNYPWADFIPLAMENREITAAVGTPALAVFLRRELGAKITLPPAQTWPFNPSYGIIAREDFLEEESLKVFLELHEEANNHMINSPRETAETVANVSGFIDSNFALEVMSLSPRYCAALPKEYIQSTMDFVPVMLDLGYLSKPLKMSEIFYTPLIEEVHTMDDHYNRPLSL
jgi:NitT/TauT family transport system substrate-binding protein